MDRESEPDNKSQPQSHGRFFNWLDRRVGLRKILHEALDEPIPGGARWAYIFGSGLLFIFISQVITGIFLALYYVPSSDHAHISVAYITKQVAAGSFLRSLHVYGASAMIIVLVLHIGQTFLFGSYKGRRELLWLSGCVLLALVLGMAFTGYLLPWDEKAYFATAVGTNILSEIPFIGEPLKQFLRGGSGLGTLTISRFFALHVFFIPAMIFLFVALHIFLFRKAGAAGPPSQVPLHPRRPAESFYPRQLLMDLGFTLALICALGLLAYFHPAPLGPRANPADTLYVPRPEWYYRSFFEWLKFWRGAAGILGILVVPLVLAVLFAGLPFYDRRPERRPWRRPLAVGFFGVVFVGTVYLGARSYQDDQADPSVAAELAREAQETRAYMRAPFVPQAVGSAAGFAPASAPASASLPPSSVISMAGSAGAAAASPAANPLTAQGGKIFASHTCAACHGQGGVGTPIAPRLIGIGSKFSPAQLEDLFHHPTPKMNAGGMPPVQLSPQDMKALIAYLDSLK
jgi:ubiquinol-cytochrome c reductase cytochrome b subunit